MRLPPLETGKSAIAAFYNTTQLAKSATKHHKQPTLVQRRANQENSVVEILHIKIESDP